MAMLGVCPFVDGQDVTIQVNTQSGQKPVSPYIYGRNNNFSDVFGSATSTSQIKYYKEAGLRFARENAGNNLTKYNWRKKLSSHPDWYNNVYEHDWDYSAQTIQEKMPEIQAMWGFQLIGKVADNKNHNFNDWSYNGSQWWTGCSQNLAGGGEMNAEGGGKALVDGNPDLYLTAWDADSTTAILNHWFGEGGLGLDKDMFRYWSMDNEPEIWNGTHDDVMPTQLPASDFMDSYFAVAKMARERFPEIKLTGPVTANEWQWFKYSDQNLKIDNKYYCWLEYFIKRVADEQKETGIRLLDVLDIHWYPSESSNTDVVNLYRVFYDQSYAYPGANGVKTINGGWESSLNKMYIFKRINDWLNKYMGADHGVTLALTECAINGSNANVISVAYASMLGTFANNGVEVFTPWTWNVGMWETLHLFSRYAKSTSVETTSTADVTVSGYSTLNTVGDSLTVILVNRDVANSKEVKVNIADFSIWNGEYTTLQLSNLPSSETFKSHSSNALKASVVDVNDNSFSITLPALSTTAVVLKAMVDKSESRLLGTPDLKISQNDEMNQIQLELTSISGNVDSKIDVYNEAGQKMDSYKWIDSGANPFEFSIDNYGSGLYFVKVTNDQFSQCKKVLKRR